MANPFTPGYTVANTLQEILASKRLEARQAANDALNKANIESQIRDRDEVTRYNAEARLGQTQQREALADTRRASLYTPGESLGPSDTKSIQTQNPNLSPLVSPAVDPDQTASSGIMVGNGSAPIPAPGRPTGLNPALTPQPFDPEANAQLGAPNIRQSGVVPHAAQWIGTTGQQKEKQATDIAAATEARRVDAIKQLSTLTPDTEAALSPFKREALYHEAFGSNAPAAIAAPKGDRNVLYFDESDGRLHDGATGKVVLKAGPNDVIERRSRPPASETTTNYIPFDSTDQQGNQVRTGFNPRNNKFERSGVPDGLVIGGKVGVPRTPTAAKPSKVSDRTWTEWINAKGAMMKNPTNPTVQALATTQGLKVINEFPAPQDVQVAIAKAWKHPEARKMTTDQLRTKFTGDSSPAIVNSATQLWDLLTQ